MQSKSQELSVLCDVCGFANAKTRYINRAYGKGGNLLVVENVPVISCPNCGTSYLTASTLKEIDRIKRNRGQVAIAKPIAVASFAN